MLMPVNAADLTAAAYGRRKPRYPVITETLGLALVLLINRSTTRAQAIWLADPAVSDALCRPAEAFARALEHREPPPGWRGGALASLRSLPAGALHEAVETPPRYAGDSSSPAPVDRFWLEDDEQWHWRDGGTPSPVRDELARRLAPRPGIGEAWDALAGVFFESGPGGRRPRGTLALWSSLHESPNNTRELRAQIVEGRDLAAEWAARRAELLAGYQAERSAQPADE